MTSPCACPRETEVLELVAIGAWPARAGADLRAHASGCPACQDVAAVSLALEALDEGDARASLPDARLVWHRAQMRAREAALRQATRPILFAQVAGIAGVLIVAALWILGAGPSIAHAAAWAWTTGGEYVPRLPPSDGADRAAPSLLGSTPWLVVAALLGVVATISVALAVSRLADGRLDPRKP